MAILECILHTFFPFLNTRGVVLLQGFLFLMQQGTPHLDHNDRSSPTGCLELECPFLKPCLIGYFECVYVCVCEPARLTADSYATVPYPRTALPRHPPVVIHKELL